MCCSTIHQFEYPQKSSLVDFSDWVLTGPRRLCNGKTITCYKLDEETATFIESRPYRGKIIKIASLAAAVLAGPLILPAMIFKKCDDRDREIIRRYMNRSPKDNFWKEHLLSHDLVTRLTAKAIMKITGLDDFTLSMQLHGDKILRKIAPWRYEGGQTYPIADKLLKKVARLAKHKDPEVASASKKAKSVLEKLIDTSKKMAPSTYANIVSLKYLFNPGKRLDDLAEDIGEDIKRLQTGETFMIPLTFYTSTKGFRHIATTVRKVGDDHYDWHIFRADIGEEGEIGWIKEGEVSELVVSGLTKKQITGKGFLKKILKYGTAARQDRGEKFFQFLLKYEEEHDNVAIIPGKTKKKTPFSDTFPLKTLNFALKELLGKNSYKKFMFFLKLDDYADLKEKVDNNLISDPKQKQDAERILPHAEKKIKARFSKLKHLFSEDTLISILSSGLFSNKV